jgi:hypothetical protein
LPFADDYSPTEYVNEDVTPTGTPDLSAENLNNAELGIKELYTALSTLYTAHEALQADFDALSGSDVVEDTTFITGLRVEYVSATQYRVTSGQCYIPAAGAVSELAANSTRTPSIGANTWYYVYAINVGGNLSFEESTTVPIVYRGTAKQKTGDASRRLVGAFKTNGSSQIMKSIKVGDKVQWLENVYALPLWVAGGTHATNTFAATTETAIDLSGAMPAHSQLAHLRLANQEGSDTLYLGNADDNITLADDVALFQTATVVSGSTLDGITDLIFPTSSTRTISYRWQGSAPGSARSLHVAGYFEER